MRSAQDRRIATESAEEREARLQQLRVAQQQRIATETTSEEIEARRARDRRNHMDLKQLKYRYPSKRVHFKMRQFHSRLKSVCVPICVTKVSMHLSISHSLCSAVHNYDSLCGRSSRSPIMLRILLVINPRARMRSEGLLYIVGRVGRSVGQSLCTHVFSLTVAAVDTKRGYVGMCNGCWAQQQSGTS